MATKITYKPYELYLRIEGHAERRKRSLICAGISALSYCLEAHSAAHREYNGEIKRDDENAIFTARFYPGSIYRADVREAMDTIADGLRLFANNFPDNITFTEERGDD